MSIKKTAVILCILSMLPCPPLRASAKTWEHYYTKGLLQYREEMYNAALENLETALRLNSGLYRAATVMGRIYLLKNLRLEAIDSFKNSVYINPSQPDVLNQLGELHEYYYEIARAMEYYEKCLELAPEHIRANLNMVKHLRASGKNDEAAMRLNTSFKSGEKLAGAYLSKAEARLQIKNFAGALENYRKVIELNPADTRAYYAVCGILRMQKKYGDAVDIIEKLLRVMPESREALLMLGNLYLYGKYSGKLEKRRLDLAEKNLKAAYKLKPEDPEPARLLVELYRFKGDDIELRRWENAAGK